MMTPEEKEEVLRSEVQAVRVFEVLLSGPSDPEYALARRIAEERIEAERQRRALVARLVMQAQIDLMDPDEIRRIVD